MGICPLCRSPISGKDEGLPKYNPTSRDSAYTQQQHQNQYVAPYRPQNPPIGEFDDLYDYDPDYEEEIERIVRYDGYSI